MKTAHKLRLVFAALVPATTIATHHVHADPPRGPVLGHLPRFSQPFCGASATQQGDEVHALQGLAPTTPRPGYLVLRRSGLQRDGQTVAYTVDAAGVACSGARDTAACAARIEATRPSAKAPTDSLAPYFLVAQTGETQRTIETWPQLRGLLGPIDTLGEAGLVARLRGFQLSCAQSTGELQHGHWALLARTGGDCGVQETKRVHLLHVERDGRLSLDSVLTATPGNARCSYGRRPEGWDPTAPASVDSGAHFALLAELEAASVVAFERIVEELLLLGAPASLVRRARQAARDEVRHARQMRALALRFGGVVRKVAVMPAAPRALLAFAIDNATEGCVRETFGALLAWERAARTTDARIGQVMHGIARDETRHAALSWDLAEWAEERLTVDERACVQRARTRAIEDLAAASRSGPIAVDAGEPSHERTLELLEGLRATWFEARAA